MFSSKTNGKRIQKILKEYFFFRKSYFFSMTLNSTFSLLFSKVHNYVLLKIFNFSDFNNEISINDQLYSSNSRGKNNLERKQLKTKVLGH